jgi:hypothetical protein
MKRCLLVSLVLTLLVGCTTANGGRRLAKPSASAREFLQRLAGSYYLDTGGGTYDEYTIHPDATYTETQYGAPFFGAPAKATTRSGPVRVQSDAHFELVFAVGSLEFAAAPDFASFQEDNGLKYVRR